MSSLSNETIRRFWDFVTGRKSPEQTKRSKKAERELQKFSESMEKMKERSVKVVSQIGEDELPLKFHRLIKNLKGVEPTQTKMKKKVH